jgi:hypothetical protein
MAAELLLVQLKLLLEGWHLVNHLALGVFKLTDNCCTFAFLLGQGELEVLALCLHNLGELSLLVPELVNLLFEHVNFLAVLRLLSSHLRQQSSIELLCSGSFSEVILIPLSSTW